MFNTLHANSKYIKFNNWNFEIGQAENDHRTYREYFNVFSKCPLCVSRFNIRRNMRFYSSCIIRKSFLVLDLLNWDCLSIPDSVASNPNDDIDVKNSGQGKCSVSMRKSYLRYIQIEKILYST